MSSYNNSLSAEQVTAPQSTSSMKARGMRFFFHLRNGEEQIPDMAGIEAENLEVARLQAVRAVHELLQEEGDEATDWSGWTLTVADSNGKTLASLELGTLQDIASAPEKRSLNG